MSQAIILTLQLDQQTADYFEDLRGKHYPSALNKVPAHLTLFHQLPGSSLQLILAVLAKACADERGIPFRVTGPMRLGRGVAFDIQSDQLLTFRKGLADAFSEWVSGPDKAPFRPHVTIQNKAAPHEASALHDHLLGAHQPFDGRGEGVQIWRYNAFGAARGAWSPAGAMLFQGKP